MAKAFIPVLASLVIGAMATALLVVPGRAQTKPDAGLPAPSIRIEVKSDPVDFDYSRSHKELKSLAQCDRPATSGKFLGLSRASVDTRFSCKLAVRQTRAGYEGGLISVDVTLHVGERKVYIASELPKDSCSFEETMTHEMRHVSIDDTLVGLFRGHVRQALQDALPSVSAVRGATPQDVSDVIQARLQEVLDREMRALRIQRLDRHQAFDSSEEYVRLGKACGGETKALITAAEAGDPGWHAPMTCPKS